MQCYRCKEFSHIKRFCPLNKNKKKDEAGSSVNFCVAKEDFGFVLTISEGKNTSPSDAWVLDSGCIMHVCSRKDYFDTFHECKDGNLFMGDGYPCKVEGFGTVKIMMYVGVVHTIGDVAYVPKMRKNLISLGRLDFLGCKYFVAGEAMESRVVD